MLSLIFAGLFFVFVTYVEVLATHGYTPRSTSLPRR